MNLRLVRNAVSNLIGALVPALVALGTVPLVVSGLGEAGYGLYSLVTAIVGYFAVIDINVTAGSVKFIAEHNARDERDKIDQTLCFGVVVYALIGAAGGARAVRRRRLPRHAACSRCRPRWCRKRSPPCSWPRSASSSASCRPTCKACRSR